MGQRRMADNSVKKTPTGNDLKGKKFALKVSETFNKQLAIVRENSQKDYFLERVW